MVYRVLNISMDIARYETNVDLDVLILSCILHDIGRNAQLKNPKLCHAEVGAQIAYDFLVNEGLDTERAMAIKSAIAAHRYRSKHTPQSIEAKILFDADTIDATGAMGIARSLLYEGNLAIPLYNVDSEGAVISGTTKQSDSFLREYEFKLKYLYERLYTTRAKEIAAARRQTAQQFYNALVNEINSSHMPLDKVFNQL